MCLVSFADVSKWQKPLFVLSFVPMDVELTEKEFLPARFLWGTHASMWDLCPFSRSDQVSHERFTDASAWSNKKRSAVWIETMLTVSQDNISQYCRTPLLNIIETALSLIFIVIISRIIFWTAGYRELTWLFTRVWSICSSGSQQKFGVTTKASASTPDSDRA